MSDAGVTVVLCTAPEEEAAGLADRLLEEGHIACANLLGPVESRFLWEGRREIGREILLVLKTASRGASALRRRLVELHSYDVPEVLEIPVAGGHAPYLEWVLAACTAGRGTGDGTGAR